ncbi:MAG: tetratricopeptide repeat protein [bacterium]|nr:tetratricopeptide repeat protein [bacterium]
MGRGPAAAALFFLFTLGPVLGFLNVYPMRFSYVADHFQYLASLGPIALFAGAAAVLWKKREWGLPAGTALAALLLIALGALSYRQGRIYKSAETLWRDTAAKNPASWMAQNHLGRILAARGDLAGAVARYRAALKVKPDHAYSLNNLGNALLQMGKKAEAIETLRRAAAADGTYANARNSLGRALLAAGRVDAAIETLQEALRINPRFAPAHSNLGMAFMQKSASDRAVAAFRRAIELSPRLTAARYNLAIALSEMKRYGEAIAALRPGAAERQAAQLLAWLLATAPDARHRDGRAALRLIEGSLRGKRVSPQSISIFAAALAETGQFQGAAEAAREAAAMAERAGNTKNAALYRAFAGLYAAGKPYRLPAP